MSYKGIRYTNVESLDREPQKSKSSPEKCKFYFAMNMLWFRYWAFLHSEVTLIYGSCFFAHLYWNLALSQTCSRLEWFLINQISVRILSFPLLVSFTWISHETLNYFLFTTWHWLWWQEGYSMILLLQRSWLTNHCDVCFSFSKSTGK